MDAINATLSLVDWQVFGTFTWRPSLLGGAKSREDRLWSFLKGQTEGKRAGKFYDMPVVVRWELGEIGGQPHAHVLLAGLEQVTIDWMFKVGANWNRECGLARLRFFWDGATGDETITYVTKRLSFVQGKDRYELGKFSFADRLVMNDAAWVIMCRRSGVEPFPQLRTA